MYTHIVFDVDGTILDTDAAQLATCSTIVEMATGIDRPPETYAHILGILNDETVLARAGIREAEKYARLWDDVCAGLSSEVRAFDGVMDAIAALHEDGMEIGIVTSRHRRYLSSDNDGIFEKPPFGIVICGDEVVHPKPSPEPLEKYIALGGISPRDVLYIGDSAMDYESAGGCGCDFGCVNWGKRKFAVENDKPALSFNHPSEIVTAVRRMRESGARGR
jgi:phosphoglycolate phosphatase-like HAD superfamily hydrolase